MQEAREVEGESQTATKNTINSGTYISSSGRVVEEARESENQFVDEESSRLTLGTTPPISTTQPTEYELACESQLQNFLLANSSKIFETIHGQRARETTLHILEEMVIEWASKLAAARNIAATEHRGGGIQLKVFGSQRLGVHTSTSDLGIVLGYFRQHYSDIF